MTLTTWILDTRIATLAVSCLREPNICVKSFQTLRCVRMARHSTKIRVFNHKIEDTCLSARTLRLQDLSMDSRHRCNTPRAPHLGQRANRYMVNVRPKNQHMVSSATLTTAALQNDVRSKRNLPKRSTKRPSTEKNT